MTELLTNNQIISLVSNLKTSLPFYKSAILFFFLYFFYNNKDISKKFCLFDKSDIKITIGD